MSHAFVIKNGFQSRDNAGITGSLTSTSAVGFVGTASWSKNAITASNVTPTTSSFWLPLNQSTDMTGFFSNLDQTLANSFFGASYNTVDVLFPSGSGAISGREWTLDNSRLVGLNFQQTCYFVYSGSVPSSFTPYFAVGGIDLQGSNSSAGWWAGQNGNTYTNIFPSGISITPISFSAVAPKANMVFSVRAGCGSPASHNGSVYLLGVKIDNW